MPRLNLFRRLFNEVSSSKSLSLSPFIWLFYTLYNTLATLNRNFAIRTVFFRLYWVEQSGRRPSSASDHQKRLMISVRSSDALPYGRRLCIALWLSTIRSVRLLLSLSLSWYYSPRIQIFRMPAERRQTHIFANLLPSFARTKITGITCPYAVRKIARARSVNPSTTNNFSLVTTLSLSLMRFHTLVWLISFCLFH